jgi:hypothetical protein
MNDFLAVSPLLTKIGRGLSGTIGHACIAKEDMRNNTGADDVARSQRGDKQYEFMRTEHA